VIKHFKAQVKLFATIIAVWYRPTVRNLVYTSNSAVAKRPRDALRLSVSFKSLLQYLERTLLLLVTSASDLLLRTIICCSVVFGVTLRLLVINASSSSPAINKLCRLLPPMHITNLPRFGGIVLITPAVAVARR